MVDSVPAWKWWHPVPLLHVLGIGVVAQLLCIVPLVALRAVTGWDIPMAGAGGGGGLIMFFWVRHLAKKRLAGS